MRKVYLYSCHSKPTNRLNMQCSKGVEVHWPGIICSPQTWHGGWGMGKWIKYCLTAAAHALKCYFYGDLEGNDNANNSYNNKLHDWQLLRVFKVEFICETVQSWTVKTKFTCDRLRGKNSNKWKGAVTLLNTALSIVYLFRLSIEDIYVCMEMVFEFIIGLSHAHWVTFRFVYIFQ